MARPREFDPDKATSRIMDAFWRAGYDATSLADLMAATGLKKGSLYAAFGDKRAMYLRGLAAYDAKYVDTVVDMMMQREGEHALRAFLELPAQAVEGKDRRGCFLCNASAETEALDEPARSLAESSRRKLAGAIHTALKQAQDQGARIPDLEARADQVLALYFGMRILARSGTPVERIRAAANDMLNQLGV